MLPYLQNADISLTPLFFESGTRFKILEAGACRVPMVSTTLGAEGLPVEHERDLLLADSAINFADCIVKLLKSRDYADKLTRNCYQRVKEHFSIESLTNQASEIIDFLENHD